jgi:hypothetical protein
MNRSKNNLSLTGTVSESDTGTTLMARVRQFELSEVAASV